ncbi:MAG: hypothetical protein ACREXW_02455 [Gammaproteobacteria bacterium]
MRSELAAFGEMASQLANPLVLIGLALLLFFGVHRALLRSGILPPVDRRTSGVIVQSLLRYGFWIAVLLIVLGIGYAGYKTHRETQLAIVNAETVSTASRKPSPRWRGDRPRRPREFSRRPSSRRRPKERQELPRNARPPRRRGTSGPLQTKDLQMQEYQDRHKALTEAVQALAKKQNAPGGGPGSTGVSKSMGAA